MSHNHSHEVATDTPRGRQQDRALKAVSGIKGGMFIVEALSGYIAHSASMMADSADMFEDALGAVASMIVRKRSHRAQAGVAIGKALVMAGLGLCVLGGAVFTLLNPAALPAAAIMGIVGGLGLAANATCAGVLFRFRKDNLNMKAAWKCLRNDMLSNVGVLVAAALDRACRSGIPDLVIGVGVAVMCIKSAVDILREAIPLFHTHKIEKAGTPAKQKPRHALAPAATPKPAAGFKNALRRAFRRSATTASVLPVQPPQMPPLAKSAAHALYL